MKKVKEILENKGVSAIIILALIVLFIILSLGLSWILTCGIVKLITMCFGLEFSWAIATGIWLVLVLLKAFFGKIVNVNVER